MSEKRFEWAKSDIEKYWIYDNDKEDAYFISCDEHCVECLTDLLNELDDQRVEKLELLAEQRGKMVAFATALIQSDGSEEMLKLWNSFREDMFKKWRDSK